jgi:membrane-bound lytic murein transglycosylase D
MRTSSIARSGRLLLVVLCGMSLLLASCTPQKKAHTDWDKDAAAAGAEEDAAAAREAAALRDSLQAVEGQLTEEEFSELMAQILAEDSGSRQFQELRQLFDRYLGSSGDASKTRPDEAVDDTQYEAMVNLDTKGLELSEDECDYLEGTEAVFYDVPIEVNRQVRNFIAYYTQRRHDMIQRALNRSGRYTDMMREVLRAHGMPEDLCHLVLIESAFRPTVTSHAAARGLWQFIRPTGRRYGLNIDWWHDERCDPYKATVAACGYLSELYSQFGDWYLALAAYNCGEYRVHRVVKKYGTKDFWELTSHRRSLPRETRNYVPGFIAAVIISKNPEKYGFTRDNYEPPLQYDEVLVKQSTDLRLIARCSDTTVENIQELNPELLRWCTPGSVDEYRVKVPKGSADRFYAQFSQIPKEEIVTWKKHRVSRGETLGLIARKYGSSIRDIASANQLRNPNVLSIGQELIIPSGPMNKVVAAKGDSSVREQAAPAPAAASTQAAKPATAKTPDGLTRTQYTVRSGDTLGRIAARHGVSLRDLLRWNGLTKWTTIHPGNRLVVFVKPSSTPASRQVAAAAPAPRQAATASAPTAASTTYVVRSGDNPYDIAKAHGVSVKELLSWNGLRPGSIIRPGDRLVIRSGRQSVEETFTASAATGVAAGTRAVPLSKTNLPTPKHNYRVRNGDSLWTIARRFGVSVSDLKTWNNLNSNLIKPGMILKVY